MTTASAFTGKAILGATLCHFFVAVVALLPMSAGAVSLRFEHEPTPGLSGFVTITVSIDIDPQTAYFGRLSGLGVSFTPVNGVFNQINPFGQSTAFTDINDQFVLVGALPEQDTQFLFRSDEIVVIRGSDDQHFLDAGLSGLQRLDLPNPTPFAQLVTDAPAVNYWVAWLVGQVHHDLAGTHIVPEPSTLGIVALNFLALASRRRR